MEVTGLPYWGVELKPGDKLVLERHVRHELRGELREHGHRGRADGAPRRERQPTAPALNLFQAERDNSPDCKSRVCPGRRRSCAPGEP